MSTNIVPVSPGEMLVEEFLSPLALARIQPLERSETPANDLR